MTAQILIESAARSFVLALVAALALRALRVRSAQTKHLVWTAVLAGSLCMPFLPELLRDNAPPAAQGLTVVRVPASTAAVVTTNLTPLVAPSLPSASINPYLAVYLLVAGFLLARLATGMYLTWNIARKSQPLPSLSGATRISSELRTPVTFGRTILLPANMHLWSDETLAAVLRHEQAHCRRGDFLTQAVSKFHRAVFWFNPMAWWLDRELANLAEEACDAAAVRSHDECPGYAQILLQFATKSHLSTEAGVAMARLSSVGKRVTRLLDDAFEPGERHLSTATRWKVLASMITLVFGAAIYSISLDAAAAQQPSAPAAPQTPSPTPHKVAKTKGTWSSSHGDSTPFVFVDNGQATIVSGSMDDLWRGRQLRSQNASTPFLRFRRDGKEWMVQDPASLAQVRELFRPQEELGKRQSELGELQAHLGAEQAQLGSRQSSVRVDVPDFSREMRTLSAQMSELSQRKADTAKLGEVQEKLAEMQARLGNLQGTAGEKHAQLAKLQAELGHKQAELGAKQAELGKLQAELSEKVRTQMERKFDEWLRDGKAKPVQE